MSLEDMGHMSSRLRAKLRDQPGRYPSIDTMKLAISERLADESSKGTRSQTLGARPTLGRTASMRRLTSNIRKAIVGCAAWLPRG